MAGANKRPSGNIEKGKTPIPRIIPSGTGPGQAGKTPIPNIAPSNKKK